MFCCLLIIYAGACLSKSLIQCLDNCVVAAANYRVPYLKYVLYTIKHNHL